MWNKYRFWRQSVLISNNKNVEDLFIYLHLCIIITVVCYNIIVATKLILRGIIRLSRIVWGKYETNWLETIEITQVDSVTNVGCKATQVSKCLQIILVERQYYLVQSDVKCVASVWWLNMRSVGAASFYTRWKGTLFSAGFFVSSRFT